VKNQLIYPKIAKNVSLIGKEKPKKIPPFNSLENINISEAF
jgi:hypothetical protein